MKTAIVTGAGGFIGGALTELLLKKGVVVYGVDISEKAVARHSGKTDFHPIIADFTKYDRLHELIRADVDVFYHFAWQGVFGDAFRDYRLQLANAASAGDAVTAAVRIGCKKFVFAGTYNELEVADHFDMNGRHPRWTCIYSSAKATAEIICKTIASNSGIGYGAGLTAMAYGERNRSMMLANVVLKQLVKGESPRLIKGDIPYDFIYVDDIARAFYAIGELGVQLVVKKGHSEKARYLCDKKEQRCTAVKSWRSSTSITRPNGCRGGCQSRHTVHGTTFRTRYLTDGSGTYTGEWFRWR